MRTPISPWPTIDNANIEACLDLLTKSSKSRSTKKNDPPKTSCKLEPNEMKFYITK